MTLRLLPLGLTLCASALQAAPCELHYQVQADYAKRQLHVTLRLPVPKATELALTPQWAGADHAAALRSVQSNGKPLMAVAGAPGRWLLPAAASPSQAVSVQYTLQGADLIGAHDQREMYRVQLGDAHFQAFGYGLLLLPAERSEDEAMAVCFDWHLPGQPGQLGPVFNSHGLAQAGRTQRIKASRVQLRHAVYAGGPAWRLQRRELPAGGPLHVAVRGHFPQAPDDKFAADATGLIANQRRYWQRAGDAPLPAQWLLLTPNHLPGGNQGGTLVEHAAVLHAPQDFSTRSTGFEQLVAHENLHQWLPARFGARGPGGAAEVPMYWFSEGFTDYFTHRLLLQSGHWTLAQYAERLTQRWREHQGSAARRMPVAEIAPNFFSDRVAGQQMYLRGEWLALRWEAQLAQQSSASTLAALLKRLQLPQAHAEPQLGSERLLAALEPYLGQGPRQDVQRYIVEGQTLDFDAVPPGPCLHALQEPVRLWQLGFDRASFQSGKLQGVDPNGPAHAAGLRDGMALSGYSVFGGDTSREAHLSVRDGDGPLREVRYLPLALQAVDAPAWRPLAQPAPSCSNWISLR